MLSTIELLCVVFKPQECEDARRKIMESRDHAKTAAQLVSAKHAVIEKDKKLTMQTETRRCDIPDKFEDVDRELSDIRERLVLRTEYKDAVLASNGNKSARVRPSVFGVAPPTQLGPTPRVSGHTRYGSPRPPLHVEAVCAGGAQRV